MAKPTRLLQAIDGFLIRMTKWLGRLNRVLMDGSRLSLHSRCFIAVPPLECNRSIAHMP